MEIERALERALEADDPGPAFAGKVLAAVTAEAAGAAAPAAVRRTGGRSMLWRVALPIAATVALVTAGAQWRASQAEEAQIEEAKGRAAHAQLVHALRLTGEKLNVVHRAIERSQE